MTRPVPSPVPALPDEGALEEVSPVRLAYLAALGAWSGRIDLALPKGRGLVDLRKGRVEAVVHPALPLGPWLEAEGVLTSEARARAEVEVERFGGLAPAIFALGLVDPGEAFGALSRHAAESWVVLLGESRGRFRCHPEAPPPADRLPLEGEPLGWLLRAVHRLSAEEIRRRLGPRCHAPAMKSNGAGTAIEDMGLGPREARLYPLFDGVHGPEALAGELSPEEGDRLLRLAWLLGECDFLSFGEPEGVGGPRSGASAASSPPPPRDWEAELGSARQRHVKLSRADWFTVLGLKRQCTAAEVKKAYTDAVRRWHPDRVAGGPEALLAVHRELFALATEAHRVLSEDGRRRDYLNELAARELFSEASASGPEARALGEVTALIDQERFDEAATALEGLLAQNPGLAAAWAWRAWVAVRRASNPVRVKSQALEWVTRALKLDARCGDAFLVAGRIARLFGDEIHAEKYLARAKALGAPGA